MVFVLNRALEAGLDSATAAADLTMAGLPLGGVAIFGTQKVTINLHRYPIL